MSLWIGDVIMTIFG